MGVIANSALINQNHTFNTLKKGRLDSILWRQVNCKVDTITLNQNINLVPLILGSYNYKLFDKSLSSFRIAGAFVLGTSTQSRTL